MSDPTPTPARSGIGILGVAGFITVLLGTYKLTGMEDVSWLAVFMPLILAFGLALAGLLVGLLALLAVVIAKAASGNG